MGEEHKNGHERDEDQGHHHHNDDEPGHGHHHGHEQNHVHERGHGYKTRFHEPRHAAEFDKRSTTAGIRGELTAKLVEMLALSGDEIVLDLATGTGGVARPLSKYIQKGRVIGVDQALAMLDVARRQEGPISTYKQVAGEGDSLPFKSDIFDCAFVSFSLHHFGNPEGVVKEVLQVLKNAGRFVVLDPVIEEAVDAVDVALEIRINQVFRRTHGNDFRFHTARSIQRLLTKAGYRISQSHILTYFFDQEGVEGIPTGRHWLEAAEELGTEAPELAERMKETYFTWHKHGDQMHVKGGFSYALICAVKPA